MADDVADVKAKGKEIPVSVFTGFLGAGKTTIILALLKQLPKDYRVVLLKNEFGDVEVDSQLAKESSVEAVSEILNGCMCCVLVGQMRTALLEIQEKYAPDRIIIESSGSAFPATLAWQVRQLDDEGLKLDAVVTVIDCINFTGYEDTSPTAKMQAKYTDLLLLNKHELVDERQLDKVLDALYELNTETPKLKISRDGPPAPDLIFGLLSAPGSQSRVFDAVQSEKLDRLEIGLLGQAGQHASTQGGEVQTCSVWRGGSKPGHSHTEDAAHHKHSQTQSSAMLESQAAEQRPEPLTRQELEEALSKLPSEEVWRVKGFVRLSDSGTEAPFYVLNWAFGRYETHPASSTLAKSLETEAGQIRLTVMGAPGQVKGRAKKLAAALQAEWA